MLNLRLACSRMGAGRLEHLLHRQASLTAAGSPAEKEETHRSAACWPLWPARWAPDQAAGGACSCAGGCAALSPCTPICEVGQGRGSSGACSSLAAFGKAASFPDAKALLNLKTAGLAGGSSGLHRGQAAAGDAAAAAAIGEGSLLEPREAVAGATKQQHSIVRGSLKLEVHAGRAGTGSLALAHPAPGIPFH